MRKIFPSLFFSFLIVCSVLQAQLVSGPMLGQVELRTATILAEVKPGETVSCWYWPEGDERLARKQELKTNGTDFFAPVKFELGGLEVNTRYNYLLTTSLSAKKPAGSSGSFTTKDLWQFRKPVPEFSFLAGSCSFINDYPYDRPGTPYGQDSSIFETMAKEDAEFMVWLGDNWYLREVDYRSNWGLWHRASRDRALTVRQAFWKKMPQYAIWDDHDYGPNDADKSYSLKEESRKVFQSYWGNPSFGEKGEGVYTSFKHADAEFFLLDARYFRSSDKLSAFVGGKPNPEKRMFGPMQMEWLKNALASSLATFKIIVAGSQILNPMSPWDCMRHFPVEYDELMQFLEGEKIEGVVFLTGDRHHSEVIKMDRSQGYTLYDITASPLTAGVGRPSGKEADNPFRIPGTLVNAQNYAKIAISGNRGDRRLSVNFLGLNGEQLGSWQIGENALKYGAPNQ